MTLVGTATSVALWIGVVVLIYLVLAVVVLFSLPSAEDLPFGTAADAAFAFTLPLVLALTWVATRRRPS